MRIQDSIQALFAFLGLLTTSVATIYALAPAVLPQQLHETLITSLDSITPDSLGIMVGAFIVLYALWIARKNTAQTPPPVIDHTPPEQPVETTLHGAEINTTISELSTGLRDRTQSKADVEPVRTTVQELTIAVVARQPDMTHDEAVDQIKHGDWTTNDTAAAFVAGADGPTHSLPHRIRWWLFPAVEFDRRLSETISEVQSRYEQDIALRAVQGNHSEGIQ